VIILIVLCTIVGALIYTSWAEWTLHRCIMHRRWFVYPHAFKAHMLTHHALWRADYTYHLQPGVPIEKIHMAWWNGPAIVALGGMPAYTLALCIGFFFPAAGWAIGLTSVVVFFGYYGVYEYLHWCMHDPKDRWVERQKFFRWLNGHHVLHHRYQDNNLNVVLPLADWLFGTLMLRAKKPFAQPRGPAVPDIQPAPV